MQRLKIAFGVAAACLALAACASGQIAPRRSGPYVGVDRSAATEPRGQAPAYLATAQEPSALAFLPPPPPPGSARAAADTAVFQKTRALRDSPRWRLAERDADLDMPGALRAFDCAVGARLTPQEEPALVRLLTRVVGDVSHSYVPAKDRYARTRPFIGTDAPVCVPKDERLTDSYSYPSGHSSIGFTWALILAEAAPDRTAQIVERGEQFGDSRVVCGVHYLSDVQAGRLVGSAVTARLNADPAFQADLVRGRAELDVARKAVPPDPVQCAAETQALQTPAY